MARRRPALALLAVAVLLVWLPLPRRLAAWRGPGNSRGYAPRQPIAYSHRLHAGELAIPCLFCHGAAERGPHASLPSLASCLDCHRHVTAPWGAQVAEERLAREEGRAVRWLVSSELQKLYDALGLDERRERDPRRPRPGVRWVRVHRLPAFVVFDHGAHAAAGVACETCHGPVDTMERIRQENDLTMGWCVECHRRVNEEGVEGRAVDATLECSSCHH